MEDLFISNLNAIGKIAMRNDKHYKLAQRLEDAKLNLEDTPILISAWSDKLSCPDCTFSFINLMVDPSSVGNSSVITKNDFSGGQTQGVLPIEIPDNVDINQIKAIIVCSCNGYEYPEYSSVSQLDPLVVSPVGIDSSTGYPKVVALNGRKMPSDAMALPSIPSGTKVILLTGMPDLSRKSAVANTFILNADCPALHGNAKRGDVFCFVADEQEFFKCYTFDEKYSAIVNQPGKQLPNPSGSGEMFRVVMTPSLDFAEYFEERGCAGIFCLLIQDFEIPEVPASGSGESAVAAQPRVFYPKGSFFFVQNGDDGVEISKVPFDWFFK